MEPQTENSFSTADIAGAGSQGSAMKAESEMAAIFAPNEAQTFRSDWERIQTGFVDEPHKAVENANALVARTIKRLEEVFAEEKSKLEKEWDRGDSVSTEDLRIALRRYRSFFDRLLSV